MQFAIEAMRPDGTTVADVVEAGDRSAALDTLREKGLLVLRLEERAPRRSAVVLPGAGSRLTVRDLILLTRQLKMLLEAGAPVVPALEAAEHQSARLPVRALLRRLRERVEQGASLAAALQEEGSLFDPVFRSMVAAGEATASLPATFGRLSVLAYQQSQARKMVVVALIYPAVLSILLIGVVAILLFFVVPRFSVLFTTLNSPLPSTTKLLFAASEFVKSAWPYALGVLAAGVVAVVLALRVEAVRARVDEIVLRLPVLGRLACRLQFASVLRVWAAMLRSHVPLLDVIRQSREAVRNAAFLRALTQVEEAVASGGRVGQALDQAGIADPIIVSALRTGEENGRLSESVEFVSGWLDEENGNLVHGLTRLAEPLLLAFMGVVVGFVAMSLFLPLFDLATAAG